MRLYFFHSFVVFVFIHNHNRYHIVCSLSYFASTNVLWLAVILLAFYYHRRSLDLSLNEIFRQSRSSKLHCQQCRLEKKQRNMSLHQISALQQQNVGLQTSYHTAVGQLVSDENWSQRAVPDERWENSPLLSAKSRARPAPMAI